VLRDKNTDADGLCDDERIYYLGDANFNITTLVNTGGDAIERYVYTPYGVLTVYDATWANIRSTSSYANAYTYTGRQLDAETGLYYYRARFFAPQLGRFCGRDPIEYRDGHNLVAYAHGRPSTMVDPRGTKCTPKRMSTGMPDGSVEYKFDIVATDEVRDVSFATGNCYLKGLFKAEAWIGDDFIDLKASGQYDFWTYFYFFRVDLGSGSVQSRTSCRILCHETPTGCFAAVNCSEGPLPTIDGDGLLATAYRVSYALNGPVVAVTWAAEAVFSYTGPSFEPSVGYGGVGTTVVFSGDTWNVPARVGGTTSWQCECDGERK
jgi:RHS repeat-associated protein